MEDHTGWEEFYLGRLIHYPVLFLGFCSNHVIHYGRTCGLGTIFFFFISFSSVASFSFSLDWLRPVLLLVFAPKTLNFYVAFYFLSVNCFILHILLLRSMVFHQFLCCILVFFILTLARVNFLGLLEVIWNPIRVSISSIIFLQLFCK